MLAVSGVSRPGGPSPRPAPLKVFVLHTAVLAEFPLGLPYSEAVKNAVSASEDACVEMEGFRAADPPPTESHLLPLCTASPSAQAPGSLDRKM
jgi:hypothetical protein